MLVVEVDGDGEGNGGSYGVGGGSSYGTQYCWELDWYVYNDNIQQYEYSHTQTVYCWYAE